MRFNAILVSVFLSTTVLSASAFAAEAANTSSPHNLLFNFGWTEGGMSFGMDYENNFDRTYGLGGYVRMYGDDDDRGELTTFGVFVRPHFTRQSWDLYVSPGFGYVQEDRVVGNSDESYFGPSLAIGLLYQFTYAMAFGVENFQIYGWFGDDEVSGQRSNELLAKFRYSF